MASYDTLPSSFAAGQILTALSLQEMLALLNGTGANGGLLDEVFVPKTVDETVTSSTAMQNDDALFTNLATSASYRFVCNIRYGAVSAAQIKIGFTVPAGATLLWTSFGLDNAVTGANIGGSDFADRGGSTPTLGCNTLATNLLKCNAIGRVDTTGTAGNLQLQWAQAVSSGTGSVVKAASFLYVVRVS